MIGTRGTQSKEFREEKKRRCNVFLEMQNAINRLDF